MSTHPLKCDACSDFRSLKIKEHMIQKDLKGIKLKIPYLYCSSCKQDNFTNQLAYFDSQITDHFKELEEGEYASITFPFEKRFAIYEHLEFQYSPEDYYFIPGLYRETDSGYLCPVFFDKDLLLYYNNHPDYSVKFFSFSSGNIYHNDTSLFRWGFGINRNGNIFKWLGDLNEDFEDSNALPHLKRFQASNIASDHDVYSKFYLSQNPYTMTDAFQKSDNETKIFSLINELNKQFINNLKYEYTKININDITETYKPPILEEREQIFNAYVNLNKILIENIRIKSLKQALTAYDDSLYINNKGSIKTLELFCKFILSMDHISTSISPLYVLYDLRQLQGHISNTSTKSKYNSCKERLDLDITDNHFVVYKTLITKIITFLEELIKVLKERT